MSHAPPNQRSWNKMSPLSIGHCQVILEKIIGKHGSIIEV